MKLNFDNSAQSVPAYDIQIIRGLLAEAVLQACTMLENEDLLNQNYQLEADRQYFVLKEWIKCSPDRQNYWGSYEHKTISDIEKASGGSEFVNKITRSATANYVSPTFRPY
jgi:hypothetical protein